MNACPESRDSAAVIRALEARMALLEEQLESVRAEIIPWHVICAAVAAIMPDVRVVRVTPLHSDRWRSTGVLRHVISHGIR